MAMMMSVHKTLGRDSRSRFVGHFNGKVFKNSPSHFT